MGEGIFRELKLNLGVASFRFRPGADLSRVKHAPIGSPPRKASRCPGVAAVQHAQGVRCGESVRRRAMAAASSVMRA
jgi:hypothetical protein